MSMKNFNGTIENRIRELPACSAVLLSKDSLKCTFNIKISKLAFSENYRDSSNLLNQDSIEKFRGKNAVKKALVVNLLVSAHITCHTVLMLP